ncbi:MAG: hypothetical protein JNL11_19865 [Bdellovibrionaceae bacterium]|nr:hypothetical protein [Pseudobdellovibrionaceae bacterium]
MGKVIPFSQIDTYTSSLEDSGAFRGTIFDTNILISASYEIRDSHTEVVDLWAYLQKKKYRLFATVCPRMRERMGKTNLAKGATPGSFLQNQYQQD